MISISPDTVAAATAACSFMLAGKCPPIFHTNTKLTPRKATPSRNPSWASPRSSSTSRRPRRPATPPPPATSAASGPSSGAWATSFSDPSARWASLGTGMRVTAHTGLVSLRLIFRPNLDERCQFPIPASIVVWCMPRCRHPAVPLPYFDLVVRKRLLTVGGDSDLGPFLRQGLARVCRVDGLPLDYGAALGSEHAADQQQAGWTARAQDQRGGCQSGRVLC